MYVHYDTSNTTKIYNCFARYAAINLFHFNIFHFVFFFAVLKKSAALYLFDTHRTNEQSNR